MRPKQCTYKHCNLGLPLETEAPVMTPNSVDFSFSSSFAKCCTCASCQEPHTAFPTCLVLLQPEPHEAKGGSTRQRVCGSHKSLLRTLRPPSDKLQLTHCLLLLQPEPHEAKVAQLDREFVAGYPLNISLPGRHAQLSTADLANMPTEQSQHVLRMLSISACELMHAGWAEVLRCSSLHLVQFVTSSHRDCMVAAHRSLYLCMFFAEVTTATH